MAAGTNGQSNIEISVVIVNYNGRKFLPRALQALQANTASDAVEIIVVDSASTDGSADEISSARLAVKVIHTQENVGFCRGNNIGVQAARGRLIAFVQPDGEVQPQWDMALCQAMSDTEVGVAGGVVLKMREGEIIDSAGMAVAPNLAGWSLCENMTPQEAGLYHGERRVVMGVSPAFLMVRRVDHLAIGGFWEELWMYGDEPDYALRAARLGKAVICADSQMRHWVGGAAGAHQSPLRLYQSSRNRLLNIARHLPLIRAFWAIALAAAFDALQLLQQRHLQTTRAIVRGWYAGARGMRAARTLSTPTERATNVKQLTTLREAVRQQRALGRVGL
jgi:hypothetical protein